MKRRKSMCLSEDKLLVLAIMAMLFAAMFMAGVVWFGMKRTVIYWTIGTAAAIAVFGIRYAML